MASWTPIGAVSSDFCKTGDFLLGGDERDAPFEQGKPAPPIPPRH
jgi:hypothetical protein